MRFVMVTAVPARLQPRCNPGKHLLAPALHGPGLHELTGGTRADDTSERAQRPVAPV